MPHWTLPKPPAGDPTAETATAIAGLQTELDKLFDRPGGLSAAQLDTVSSQVKTFYDEFNAHVEQARKRLST